MQQAEICARILRITAELHRLATELEELREQLDDDEESDQPATRACPLRVIQGGHAA